MVALAEDMITGQAIKGAEIATIEIKITKQMEDDIEMPKIDKI